MVRKVTKEQIIQYMKQLLKEAQKDADGWAKIGIIPIAEIIKYLEGEENG